MLEYEKESTMKNNMVMERDFKVDETQCEGCESNIEKRLLAAPGVLAAKVEAETGKVWIQYDVSKVRFDALPPIVEEAGFRRIFKLSEERHQDYIWREKEEELLNANHDGE